MSPERRRVVLDEDINWKLTRELQGRGRSDATALKQLGLDEKVDGAVIKALAGGGYEPFVLVTYDNKMPTVHKAELDHHGTTLAVVDIEAFRRTKKPDSEQEQYIRDVVHRWLHRIERMPAKTRRCYSPTRSRPC